MNDGRLRLAGSWWSELERVVGRYRLRLRRVATGSIPGSYWGEPEAGLLGEVVHARADTPVHSVLHEMSHVVCMDPARRQSLHTDAGGGDLEESAVCYLQLVLADELEGVGRQRLATDMDAWGYSFRLGSTLAWFESDAEDARQWLEGRGLLEQGGRPTWQKRS